MPSSSEIAALRDAVAGLEGPDARLDFRIAELFGLAPDPDSYSSELSPFGNGFDWRAPAFTADATTVAALARHLDDAPMTEQADGAAALSSLLSLLDRLLAREENP